MGEALIDELSISTPRISPDEARAAVTDFLLVGNQLVTGQPHLMGVARNGIITPGR